MLVAVGALALLGAGVVLGRWSDDGGGEDDGRAAGARVTTTTTTTTEPTTTTTETTTTSTTSTTTTTAAPTTSTSSIPRNAAGFPTDRKDLEHGGATWAVVLDGGPVPDTEPGDARFPDALAAARKAGYETGATDCDQGAPEALGLPDEGHQTVSVYFRRRTHAEEALAMFRQRGWTKGVVAEVRTFCLD